MMNPTKFGSLNKLLYVAAAQSSSHYLGETTIQIDSYPTRKFIPNTNRGTPHEGSLRSPLVQFRTNSRVQSAPYPQRFYQLLGRSGLEPALGPTPLALRTSLLPPVCALSLIGARPKLSYSASQSYHRIQPAKC